MPTTKTGSSLRARPARPRNRQPAATKKKSASKPGDDTKKRSSTARKPSHTPAGTSPSKPKSPIKRKHRPKPQSLPAEPGGSPATKMRLAKAMARAGLCSRRDGERWIEEGRVTVNGEKILSPARNVTPQDRIVVDDKPLPIAEPVRLWRYHKPRGLVTTHRDPQKRPTVFDNLPDDLPRVVSIGRLDYNTEGLLLLTTDGDLARHLELPSTGWLRRYRVRAHGRIAQSRLDALKDGVEIDGVRYAPMEATLDSQQGANAWISIALREGKNREVRKILNHLDLNVNRLIRVSFGPIQLLDLKPGAVEAVRRRVLIDQLGPKLATTLGLERTESHARDARETRSPRRRRPPAKRQVKPKVRS